MRGRILGALRQHHIRHHYAKQEGNFAITAILWDRVFGTYIPKKKKRA
jgi:sterol desaturase/sphingolipid hydroxylase (fatty acid hydroxylase superfamily)